MLQTKESLTLDRYRVEDELGSGGFSKVYKAFDVKMERYVALKYIPSSSKATAWAKREAQTSARLNHPGIATIYEYDETPDGHYLIMEHLEGITLREILDEMPVLSPEQAVAVASELAIALEYAHINYVVHRDIKPENIILLRDGRIKITDFGAARLMSELAYEGKTVATPSYMSPEQASGQRDDDRTDQFSLAIVLYEMLAGKNPFDAGSTKATMFKVVNSTPPPLTKVNDSVSKELSTSCMKALNKDSDKRYATVTDFRYKIERAMTEKLEKRQLLKALYKRASGEVYEKAVPDTISSIRTFSASLLRSSGLTDRLISGLLPAFFILLYATNISLFSKLIIAASLFAAGLVSSALAVALLMLLLVIKSFFLGFYAGVFVLLAGALYIYGTGRLMKDFNPTLPLGAFIFTKLSILFLFPVFAGLLLSPLAAGFVTAIGLLSLGAVQFAIGNQMLFIHNSTFIVVILQVLVLSTGSVIISVANKRAKAGRTLLIIITLIVGSTILYALPYWRLLDSRVNLPSVMQNASLSLIIAIALMLFLPLEKLKLGS